MSFFVNAVAYVLIQEGGFTCNKNDSGAGTCWGITAKTLANYRKIPNVSMDEVQALGQDEAKAIYKSLYWDEMRLDAITDTGVATALLDSAVNIGPGTMMMMAQRAANVTADGIPGPNTFAAINGMGNRNFLNKFIPLLVNHYVDIAINDSKNIVFLKGWLARCQRYLTLMT